MPATQEPKPASSPVHLLWARDFCPNILHFRDTFILIFKVGLGAGLNLSLPKMEEKISVQQGKEFRSMIPKGWECPGSSPSLNKINTSCAANAAPAGIVRVNSSFQVGLPWLYSVLAVGIRKLLPIPILSVSAVVSLLSFKEQSLEENLAMMQMVGERADGGNI